MIAFKADGFFSMTTHSPQGSEKAQPHWFIGLHSSGEADGPYTWDDIVTKADDGTLPITAYLWAAGTSEWVPASHLPLPFDEGLRAGLKMNKTSPIYLTALSKYSGVMDRLISTIAPVINITKRVFRWLSLSDMRSKTIASFTRPYVPTTFQSVKSYVIDHWKGHFPVSWTLFINGAFLSFLTILSANFINVLFPNIIIGDLINLLMSGIIVTVSIWQAVGINRSTSLYIIRSGKWMTGRLIHVCVILVCLIQAIFPTLSIASKFI